MWFHVCLAAALNASYEPSAGAQPLYCCDCLWGGGGGGGYRGLELL